MTAHDFSKTEAQSIYIQPALNFQTEMNVVSGAFRLKLLEKPQTLLGIGQRGFFLRVTPQNSMRLLRGKRFAAQPFFQKQLFGSRKPAFAIIELNVHGSVRSVCYSSSTR